MVQRTLALDWSPNGKQLAAAGGIPGELGEVRVFNPVNGKFLQWPIVRAMSRWMFASTLPGSMFAVADAENRITLYRAVDFSRLRLIDNHADWVWHWRGVRTENFWSPRAGIKREKFLKPRAAKQSAPTVDTQKGGIWSGFRSDGNQVYSTGRDAKIHVWKAGSARVNRQTFWCRKGCGYWRTWPGHGPANDVG
ncbi:MAG: hypothetical protein Ct9H300mP7_3330 [Verrucomicrobiota bacterium]|nr:MAG: hypothetical protein Ct9H300mP7_3330 [Verrucomicrobiota bacterium]